MTSSATGTLSLGVGERSSVTPSDSATGSFTPTPSPTATPTPSAASTRSPTGTASPTGTPSATASPTTTPTAPPSASPTPSATISPGASQSATPSGSATPSLTGSDTPSSSGTGTDTGTVSGTGSATPSPAATSSVASIVAAGTLSRPAAIGRRAVRGMRRSASRSRIWLAMLELAATRVVPSRSQNSAGPPAPRPAVSHMLATTVARTMTEIRGRVRREMSAAIIAPLLRARVESEGCIGIGPAVGTNVATVKSDAKSGGGVMRMPFRGAGQPAAA